MVNYREVSGDMAKGRVIKPPKETLLRNVFITTLVLFGIGIIPLVVERTIPVKFKESPADPILNNGINQFTERDIEQFLKNPNAIAVYGRALYPRFYREGEGEPGGNWPAYEVREYPRLAFFMVGQYKGDVIIPMESSPVMFPHASDVLIFGCLKDSYLDGAIVKIIDNNNIQPAILLRDPIEKLHCPLISP
jgi:hypothetical protein